MSNRILTSDTALLTQSVGKICTIYGCLLKYSIFCEYLYLYGNKYLHVLGNKEIFEVHWSSLILKLIELIDFVLNLIPMNFSPKRDIHKEHKKYIILKVKYLVYPHFNYLNRSLYDSLCRYTVCACSSIKTPPTFIFVGKFRFKLRVAQKAAFSPE